MSDRDRVLDIERVRLDAQRPVLTFGVGGHALILDMKYLGEDNDGRKKWLYIIRPDKALISVENITQDERRRGYLLYVADENDVRPLNESSNFPEKISFKTYRGEDGPLSKVPWIHYWRKKIEDEQLINKGLREENGRLRTQLKSLAKGNLEQARMIEEMRKQFAEVKAMLMAAAGGRGGQAGASQYAI